MKASNFHILSILLNSGDFSGKLKFSYFEIFKILKDCKIYILLKFQYSEIFKF
nr:MAG TPA: hypothetical protein [Caudoviricetes sp.]